LKFQAQDLLELPKFKRALEYRNRFTFGHEKIDSILDLLLEVNMATGLGVTEFMLRIMGWLCTLDANAANNIRVLKSVDEIMAAKKNGELTITKSNIVINNPIISMSTVISVPSASSSRYNFSEIIHPSSAEGLM
jgi:hypothetical protein